ncbi:unnamed protein product [Musa acuminata subsp. burmannicoides]
MFRPTARIKCIALSDAICWCMMIRMQKEMLFLKDRQS